MRPVTTGVDVTSVARIAALMERRPSFATKLFSPEEVAYCEGRPERLAARWAAKEAVRKAYGSSGRTLPTYPSISVTHRPGGAPQALVAGIEVPGLELSLSHDAGVAVAVAVLTEGATLTMRVPAEVVLPQRPDSGHKGTFGTVLVLAGSPGFPGAAALAARGALRGGAGRVKAAVAAGQAGDGFPAEVIRVPLPVQEGGFGAEAAALAADQLAAAEAVVCGPGLGSSGATREFLSGVLRQLEGRGRHLVLDADGLNALAATPGLLELLPAGSILTPHPLEAARLAGCDLAEIQGDREGAARQLSRRFAATVVLKGAATVVADPDMGVWVDDHQTAVLAAGGTGDVLAGLIGALRAQGLEPAQAARTGVFLHGQAGAWLGDTRGRAGILASEVADALVEVQEAVRRQSSGSRPG
jgi:hydroxyethylthiazole kinase-like uncharacterized protein yjeF